MAQPVPNIEVVEVRYDEAKFTELLLLVADALRSDRAGGATKLNKIVFFAEFTHLRRHHAVITGCEFLKLPQGPAPRQLLPVRRRLVERGDAELLHEDFLGRLQDRLVPLRSVDRTVFTALELATIDDVFAQLNGLTGTQVSELSHEEPGWRLTEMGETIPFATAFLDMEQVETPTSRRLAEHVAVRYGFADA